jgi:hypothetical protein
MTMRRVVITMCTVMLTGSMAALSAAKPAPVPVPVYVQKPAFVNDLSKVADDMIGSFKRGAKKEVILTETAETAKVRVEVQSVADLPTPAVNHTAAAFGVQSYHTIQGVVVRVCVAEQCDTLTTDTEFVSAGSAATAKVLQWLKDNAAALR